MLGNMVIAGFFGTPIPLYDVLESTRSRLGVVVTTFNDVFRFLLFLGIASAAIDFIQ